MMKQQLSLQNIATIAVCGSVFTYLFIPLVNKDHVRPSSSVITAKILGQAALAYAGDNNDTLARIDNNGSCILGEYPCAPPDVTVMTFQGISIQRAAKTMFLGAIVPYASEYRDRWHSAELGPTDWKSVYRERNRIGIEMSGYDPANQGYYDRLQSQAAVNYLIAEQYIPPSFAPVNRPKAPRGRLSMIADHHGKILMTMQSAWDWGKGIEYGLGNSFVWPAYPRQGCLFANSDGLTAYIVGVEKGDGQKWLGHPKRAENNPNLKGMATFVFVDGHVEQLKFEKAEACVPMPVGQQWQYSRTGFLSTYYPKWVPEIP